MGFKNLRLNIIARIALLLLTMIGIAHTYYRLDQVSSSIYLGLFALIQVYFLLKVLDKTNREISNFLSSI